MKKYLKYFIFIILALFMSSCISVGNTKIVGCWQDIDYPQIIEEYTDDYHFTSYYSNVVSARGWYEVNGKSLTLYYDDAYCGGDTGFSCVINLEFTVTEETLIITDNQGDLVSKRIGCR